MLIIILDAIHLVGLTSHYVTQRGKSPKITVYACALLSPQADKHSTKGKNDFPDVAYGANSFIKLPQQQQIALTANHDPSVCNTVKYLM